MFLLSGNYTNMTSTITHIFKVRNWCAGQIVNETIFLTLCVALGIGQIPSSFVSYSLDDFILCRFIKKIYIIV